MTLPTLSMIVSAFDRPEHLRLCLLALQLQTLRPQLIVTDNSPVKRNEDTASRAAVIYMHTHKRECYESSECGVPWATGDFLGFPSDDNYYVPEYCERMLKAAALNDWDLVYCDALFDPRWSGRYLTMEGAPVCGRIDKGGFIIRRSLFLKLGGFPGKTGGASSSDGQLVELAASKCKHGRVPEVMWFHG